MATLKQIEANRNNSKLSTGPKTDQGKEQSRANALKHGLRAEAIEVLSVEDPAAYQHRVDAWLAKYRPADDVEDHLVRHAADLTWMIDRAKRLAATLLAERVDLAMKKVADAHHDRRAHALGKLLPPRAQVEQHYFESGPAIVLQAEVETTAAGCRKLLEVWRTLRAAALNQRPWNDEQEMHAVRLSGLAAGDITDPAIIDFVLANRFANFPDFRFSTDNWAKSRCGHFYDKSAIAAGLQRMPSRPAEAYALMAKVAERAIDRLEGVLAGRERDGDVGDQDVAAAIERAGVLASFDASDETEKIRRYQLTMQRELLRTLDALTKMRREESRRKKELGIGANEADSEEVRVEEVRQECRTHAAPNEANLIAETAPNEANLNRRQRRLAAKRVLELARRAERSQFGK